MMLYRTLYQRSLEIENKFEKIEIRGHGYK